MISIKKLLEKIDLEKKSKFANINDNREWKWHDVDYLFSVGFDSSNENTFFLNKPPMKIYKMKRGPYILEEPVENHEYVDFEKTQNQPQGLRAFDVSREVKRYEFPTFTQLINFFDKYQQDSIF